MRVGFVISRNGKERTLIGVGTKYHFCEMCEVRMEPGRKHVKTERHGKVSKRLCLTCNKKKTAHIDMMFL